jgi:hypothetical protein
MPDLILAVKKEYFDAIKSGEKTEEYRLQNDFWCKRLENRTFDRVIITLGYPKKGDTDRTLVFPFVGMVSKKITHVHFGPEPIWVFAIQLTTEILK